MMHPHTVALTRLLEAVAPHVPPHSGTCIDFTQKHWPVTDESCVCRPEVKALRKAVRDAQASLDYDTPPVLPKKGGLA